MENDISRRAGGKWFFALLVALPVTIFILYLLYHWFGLADRNFIFLYYHDMSPRVPDTSPFSAVTSSRYWMTGLVAAGYVLVFYTTVNWLIGRFFSKYRPPEWWRIWLLCAVPLSVGIPIITMTVNEPTLPFFLAAKTTIVALVGLSLALIPGKPAARRPWYLFWLALDGSALMLVLIYSSSVENIAWWIEIGASQYLAFMVIGIGVAIVGLVILGWLRRRFHQDMSGAAEILIGGACIAYVFMPLVHHVLATEFTYISSEDNFFAQNGFIQIGVWIFTSAVAFGITQIRKNPNDDFQSSPTTDAGKQEMVGRDKQNQHQ